MINKYLDILPEIKEALVNNKPVVALESTIISHGLPYPQNIKTALKCEQIIKDNKAVPATIAIMDGKIKIGLKEDELKRLAKESNVVKVSRRDLATVLTRKQTGATTVAATMICAELAGIKFFVTGGIGGVHKDINETLDVSADLEELSQTNVNVVSAGIKSILDLPRTMEYLETKGVSVIGYKTKTLPAFYVRKSNVLLNEYVKELNELANIIKTKEDLNLKGGILIVNPIPEKHSLKEEYINEIIEEALKEAALKGVTGKDITPFLLREIVEKSEGKSLLANLELVYNNALVGAKLANKYYKLTNSSNEKRS